MGSQEVSIEYHNGLDSLIKNPIAQREANRAVKEAFRVAGITSQKSFISSVVYEIDRKISEMAKHPRGYETIDGQTTLEGLNALRRGIIGRHHHLKLEYGL